MTGAANVIPRAGLLGPYFHGPTEEAEIAVPEVLRNELLRTANRDPEAARAILAALRAAEDA